MRNLTKGYKVFMPDWTCRGFQYEAAKIFEEDVTPSCCSKGFHFCKELKDCFDYYQFNPDNKIAKVVALGEIDEKSDGSICCTNKIQIVEEISWEDGLKMVNLGKGNAGLWNSGDNNSGYRNSGDWNSGLYNSGDWNSGNYNSGNRNSGDWNKTNFSSGCFNTQEPKILLFNKPSDWTYRDWLNSDARYILNQIPEERLNWVNFNDMTEEEKKSHLDCKITRGYLKKIDAKTSVQEWWDNLSDNQKACVTNLPNFDANIFYECTGIKI